MFHLEQFHTNYQQRETFTVYKKHTTSLLNKTEEQLSLNNYNPVKGSPNQFLEKLKFRIKHYGLSQELEQDVFSLDHK